MIGLIGVVATLWLIPDILKMKSLSNKVAIFVISVSLGLLNGYNAYLYIQNKNLKKENSSLRQQIKEQEQLPVVRKDLEA